MLSTLWTAIADKGWSGFFNMSLLCPVVLACGSGMICSYFGAAVCGWVQGCAVGAACGAGSALFGQLCAFNACGDHPSGMNTLCQVMAGAVSGCIGGFCGILCGFAGAALGGELGHLCNSTEFWQ